MWQAKKIWLGNPWAKDRYLDFEKEFVCSGSEKKVILKLTFDGSAVAFVNGECVFFGESADFPQDKFYYIKDITRFCRTGQNLLSFTVWHYGEDSQTYINQAAFLAFRLEQNGKVLAESDKTICARINPDYKDGFCQKITAQLGFGYFYDATARSSENFVCCEEYGTVQARKRKIANLSLGKMPDGTVSKTDRGYLIDLGKEIVGYLNFSLISEAEQTLEIRYGEHLDETGRVEHQIGNRCFSVEYRAKKGQNTFRNLLRRLAGRYLEIVSQHPVTVLFCGLIPAVYPARKITREFSDPLLKNIYDTCVYTLQCCMHEHYEDSPWREQALYALDARNEMLCGYYVFRGENYQRHNLELLADSLRPDGLLSICAPAGTDVPIPFFSLIYVLAAYEYATHTKRRLSAKVAFSVHKIYETFSSGVGENGLIAEFPCPYWNFYEWSDGSANDWQIGRTAERNTPVRYDLILNCMYVYASELYGRLFGEATDTQKTKRAIENTFYNAERNAYRLSTSEEKYSVLGNAFALLAGLGNDELADMLTRADHGLIPVTLSMSGFLYDALLARSLRYREFILQDIKKKYGRMLSEGAKTFWETEEGWKAFGRAGSLCHGWSALPAYYLSIFGCERTEQ